jgi:hypothetical protein
MALKTLKFRAKISKAGNRVRITIPKVYHDFLRKNKMIGQYVEVDVSQIPEIVDKEIS